MNTPQKRRSNGSLIAAFVILAGVGAWVFVRMRSVPREGKKHEQHAVLTATKSGPVTPSAPTNIAALQPPKYLDSIPRKNLWRQVAADAVHNYLVSAFRQGDEENNVRIARERVAIALQFLSAQFNSPVNEQSHEGKLRHGFPFENTFLQQLESKESGPFQDPQKAYLAAELFYLNTWAVTFDGQDVAHYFAQRSGQLPVTLADEIAYWGIGGGLSEIPPVKARNRPTTESIAPFADSANPVYRLLTLDALVVSLPAGIEQMPAEQTAQAAQVDQAKLDVLRHYINESEPVITKQVIDILSLASSPGAIEVLKSVRENQVRRGTDDLVQEANTAIEQVETRIKEFRRKP